MAEDVVEDIDDEVVDVTVDEIESYFERYEDYPIPLENARDSVLDALAEDKGVDQSDLISAGADEIKIDEINSDGQFRTVTGTVSEIMDEEDTHDTASQQGFIHDDTGSIRFTAWEKSEVPGLSEGATYKLKNVATSEYNDGNSHSISLNSNTEVEIVDGKTFEEPERPSYSGIIVKLYQDKCGLVKRCTVDGCNRLFENGRCPEHPDADGEFDLTIRGVIDDGESPRRFSMNREEVEDLTGITLDEAIDLAQENIGQDNIVRERFADELLHNFYEFSGWKTSRGTFIVEEVDDFRYDSEEIEDLMMRVSSLNMDSNGESTDSDDESTEETNDGETGEPSGEQTLEEVISNE